MSQPQKNMSNTQKAFVVVNAVVTFAILGILAFKGVGSIEVEAASEPEAQECYVWAQDTETKREFLACPDPDNGNICYENMAELDTNAVRFFTCQPMQ